MANLKRIQISADIAAPVARVFRLMLDPDGYRDWTSPFAEGSYYEGSWRQGEKIKFLGPTGGGMLAEVAELRPNEFLSIRHLGFMVDGVEDTESDAVRAWAPAYENYTFSTTPAGTRLVVDQEVTEEWEKDIAAAWPKALARLKALCESGGAH